MMENDIKVVDDVVVEDVQDQLEEGTMTVAEFIDVYENDKTKGKTEVKKVLKVIPYVDYEVKIALADNIVRHANIDAETGNVSLNSPMRFVFFVFTIINKYTNVRIGAGDMFGDFNALNSRGLVEFIMKEIPDKELSEFTTVVDMVADDLIANRCEIHAYGNEMISKLTSIIVDYLTPFLETMSKFTDVINEISTSGNAPEGTNE